MGGQKALGLLFCVCVVSVFCDHHSERQDPSSGFKETDRECGLVQEQFRLLNIGQPNLVPDTKIHDSEMQVCYRGEKDPQKKSCCSRKTERKYHLAAERDFSDVIRSTSSYLKGLLSTNAAHYRDQFGSMIEQSQNSTESLFSDMYHIPAREWSGPVKDLFLDMEAYLAQRDVDIHDSVSQFYDHLFPIVFHNVINDPSSVHISEDYRECLMESRQELHPFGEVPRKLSHSLGKSLTTARLILEALNLGIEVINTTDHILLDQHCSRALTKLTYCAHCEGYTSARPCKNYCFNVIRGCLAHVSDMDTLWDSFINSLELLVTNMKGTYSIDIVLHMVHSKVSEAILHATETGHKYYAKIISKCGHPQARPNLDSKGSKHHKVDSGKIKLPKDTHMPTIELHTKIEMFLRNLVASKGFYANIADTLCSSDKFSAGIGAQCWNGETMGSYNKSVIENKLTSQKLGNPEVTVTEEQPDAIVTLKDKVIHLTNLLNSHAVIEMSNAMQGDDWSADRHYGSGDRYVDDEDYDDDYSSGSGSGDGYGYGNRRPSYKTTGKKNKKGTGTGNGDGGFYIVEDQKPGSKSQDAYITQKTPEAGGSYGNPGGHASSLVSSVFTIAIVTIFSLALWKNG